MEQLQSAAAGSQLERFSGWCSASGSSRDRPPGLSCEGQAGMPALPGRHTATGEMPYRGRARRCCPPSRAFPRECRHQAKPALPGLLLLEIFDQFLNSGELFLQMLLYLLELLYPFFPRIVAASAEATAHEVTEQLPTLRNWIEGGSIHIDSTS